MVAPRAAKPSVKASRASFPTAAKPGGDAVIFSATAPGKAPEPASVWPVGGGVAAAASEATLPRARQSDPTAMERAGRTWRTPPKATRPAGNTLRRMRWKLTRSDRASVRAAVAANVTAVSAC